MTRNEEENETMVQELRNLVMDAIGRADTIKEFLESSILSKKEINIIYDFINSGEREYAK